MKIKNKFALPDDVRQAKIIQQNLSANIKLSNIYEDIKQINTIAGCDVSYSNNEKDISAAIVVLDFETLEVLEKVKIRYQKKFAFPYIPGYLSFREGPVLIEAIKKLKTIPDVFLFDGQGIAHPRGIGIAAHMALFSTNRQLAVRNRICMEILRNRRQASRVLILFLKMTPEH